jgi:pyruvate,water dikinase
MHFPHPVTPFFASVSDPIFAVPFNRMAERYALPIRLSIVCLNTYLYLNYAPAGAPPDVVLRGLKVLGRVVPGLVNSMLDKAVAGITRKYMLQLEPVMARLEHSWSQEWLPEIRQHLAYWAGFDLAPASIVQLLTHLDESLTRLGRVWEIHMLTIIPSFMALNLFEELYQELFGQADPFGAFRLLQGFDNKFLAADRALWQLSRQALTLPVVSQIMETTAAAEIIPALANSPEGQIFLAELQRFLAEYGQRGHRADALAELSWLEEPTPVLKSLQEYLSQPDRDMEAELKTQIAEREQAVARARHQLQAYPQAVITRFETLLKAAQTAVVLHEDHNYWVEQRAQYQLRRIIQEFGRRLAQAEVLEQSADIFYLTLTEIKEVTQALPQLKKQTLVAARRAELAHFQAITPPPALGTMPLMAPPNDPFGRTFSKILGGPLLPTGQTTPASNSLLRGLAASPGLIRGRARVIRDIAKADILQKGEVLVAETMMPPWTPLFTIAAAIITDVGGILSHGAVVAREYGIPAVVGTILATKIIHDGQLVEVDGNSGLVHILDDSQS